MRMEMTDVYGMNKKNKTKKTNKPTNKKNKWTGGGDALVCVCVCACVCVRARARAYVCPPRDAQWMDAST